MAEKTFDYHFVLAPPVKTKKDQTCVHGFRKQSGSHIHYIGFIYEQGDGKGLTKSRWIPKSPLDSFYQTKRLCKVAGNNTFY